MINNILGRELGWLSDDMETNASDLTEWLRGSRVVVIGAAGTIGRATTKEIFARNPSVLHAIDISENNLVELVRQLRSSKGYTDGDFKTFSIDCGSEEYTSLVENGEKYDYVLNLSAMKHVRSEKDSYSIEAMIKNNVLDAKRLLDYLKRNKPSHFFCVSTDKAANPVNVMGGSKKMMENVIMSYSKDLKITTARFANVAFSNGSLLYGYIERLLQRQPISCPSDVKRFFVSPEESGEICLLTCILGNSGDIYFPKLNENQLVNFKSITEDFFKYLKKEIKICKSEKEAKELALKLSDNASYPVCFFKTDTSGEKLFEEFYTSDDEVNFNLYESIGVVTNSFKPSFSEMEITINEIETLFKGESYNKEEIIKIMNKILPNFNHIETGKSLDQKM